MDYKTIPKASKYFTNTERHHVIQEYLSSNFSRSVIWEKYTGEVPERGHLLRWMRALGYNTASKPTSPTIVLKTEPLSKNRMDYVNQDNSFENIELTKRVIELEKQLSDAELKTIAFSTLIDIAEKELKISIRKNINTKP